MKKLLFLILFLILAVTLLPAAQKKHMVKPAKTADVIYAWRNYPLVSIHDLQYVSPDSLHFCDSIDALTGPTSVTGWTAQTSLFYKLHNGGQNDTVEIVGQIIVPAKIITFTGYNAYNFTLRDTGNGSGAWSSILVRTGAAADTLALLNADLLNYVPGDIIRIRGYIDEFPSPSTLASGTQIVPIAAGFLPDSAMNSCIEYIDTKPVPAPPTVTPDQFMKGPYTSAGKNIQFSTGEQWESCYIQMTNLKIVSIINSTNGTFSMQDASGNEVGMMDGSKWFTTRPGAPSTSQINYRDPNSTYATPAINTVISSIRGYMLSNSGSEMNRGYRIFPVFPGDIVLGGVYPAISTHRRYPVAVTPSDTVKINVKAYSQGGAPLKTVSIHYSISNGDWQTVEMTGPNVVDSTWVGTIRPVGADSLVKYYCIAADTSGGNTMYASAAGGSSGSDTSQGCFFYIVHNRPLTINDIQYTPFPNGLSGMLGAVVTIGGVVTADSSDFKVNGTDGTTPWYIQSGNAPWSGIWVAGSSQALDSLKQGDSVSVLGTVQENLNGVGGQIGRVTRIYDSTVTVLSHSHTLPSPILRKTVELAVSNGAPTAEPYEGMLVRVQNVAISNIAPTFADSTEFAVDDNSGEMIVQSYEGSAKYSPVGGDTLYGKTILHQGDKFSYIQGILYFSFNQYKLVPRNNGDYGTRTPVGTGVKITGSEIPKVFALSQNYPNPFNPSTKIEFDLPKSGMVSLKIYNVLGQEVASLANGQHAAGHYSLQFDASRLSTGIYFYRLQSASGVAVKKMLLIK